jgi:ABC-type dipeptide/oligopeptide/nickel transport system ATPase component
VGYSEGLYNNADNRKRRKDPKTLFEEALATQQQNQENKGWMDNKRLQSIEKRRPYYVNVKDGDQWNQRYVYVKKSGAKKKNKIEVQQTAQASEDRLFHNLAAKGMLARMKEMVVSFFHYFWS